MGQSDKFRQVVDRLSLAIFPTDLGWFGLLGGNDRVVALTIGHDGPEEVRAALRERPPHHQKRKRSQAPFRTAITRVQRPEMRERGPDPFSALEEDWHPALRRRLQAYAQGVPDDFRDVRLEENGMSHFQSSVRAVTRHIGYGRTLSYAELAARAGSPRAARAAGNVMAANRVPIVVPCHRVVAAGHRIGGYTGGLDKKEFLLRVEGVTL